MPFIPTDAPRPLLSGAENIPSDPPRPNFITETIPAALRTENMIGSFVSKPKTRLEEGEFDYDPFDDIEGYEEFASAFIYAGSDFDKQRIKASIDRERKDREILAASGAGGFVAAIAASFVDPTILLPVGGSLKKGESLLRIANRTAIAGGAATVVQEAGLQATQELRTPEESAMNIAGATVLSGVLGGAIGAIVNKADAKRMAAELERDMELDGALDLADPFRSLPIGKSALKSSTSRASLSSAARNTADDIVDDLNANTLFLSDWASSAAKKTGRGDVAEAADIFEHLATRGVGAVDPTFRLMTNPVNGVRQIAMQLADIPLVLNKNRPTIQKLKRADGTVEERVIMGRPTEQSVENAIGRKEERLLGSTLKGVDEIYLRYLNGREARFGDRFGAGVMAATRQLSGKGKMTPREFGRQVSRAMRRGDTHEIPAVAEAAKFTRANFMKVLEDEAVELGMFGVERAPSPHPGEPDIYVPKRPDISATAQSYFGRFYNKKKIQRDRDGVINRLFEHYRKQRDADAQHAVELDMRIKDLTTNEIEDLRRQVQFGVNLKTSALKIAANKLREKAKQDAAAAAKKKETEVQLGAAQDRIDAMTQVREMSDEQLVYYSGLARDVVRGHAGERPERFTAWVRGQGGFNRAGGGFNNGPDMFGKASNSRETVFDYLSAGDVKDYNFSGRRLIQKGGKSPDYMREAAVEAGWLPEDASIDDLMDMLRRDLSGERIVHEDDFHILDHEDFLENVRHEAEEAGVDYSDPIQLGAWMEGEEFTKLSPFKKGKLQEALRRERYAMERFKGAKERSDEIADALHEADVYARSVQDHLPDLEAQIKEFKKILAKKLKARKLLERERNIAWRRGEVGDEDLLQNAKRTLQRIEGTPAGALSYDFADATSGLSKAGKARSAGLSGRFKSRRLTIHDLEIEDYLEDDFEMVLRATARGMIPDIELTRRFGSVDMELEMKAIADEYENVSARIDPAGAPINLKQRAGESDAEFTARQSAALGDAAMKAGKDKESLIAARDKAMSDIGAVRDRLRGVYRLPENPYSLGNRIIRVLKSVQHIRLMGGVTIASIPDPARVAFTHGFRNFSGVALESFTKGIKGYGAAMKEVEDAGSAFELLLDTRTMEMADLLDDYGRYSAMERGIAAAKANFGQLSLMAPWNHVMKSASGLVVQNRILQASADLLDGKLKAGDAEVLARLGIGEADARRIGELWREHGADGKIKSANTSAWDDDRLADVFHSALRKEIDRMIVSPGQEKPLFTSTPLGSLIFQFGAYNFAATQRVTLSYAQGLIGARDAHAAMAFVTQISLGMVVAAIKMQQAGKWEEVQDWGGRRWLAEGIDRSGVLGVMTYYNLMGERLTGGKVGLSAFAGEGVLSRYHTRNALGAFMGPSFGMGQDLFTASSAISAGEGFTEGDAAAMRRLLPYQNLFYMKWLFDQIEKTTLDLAGEEGAA